MSPAATAARPPQFNIGSPFTSDETWAAVRAMVKGLRGKQQDCRTAEGLHGDSYAAFHFLAENLKAAWSTRVDVDGNPVDVAWLDALARGGGTEWDERKANSGTPLGRADFYTTQDLVDARARTAPAPLTWRSSDREHA